MMEQEELYELVLDEQEMRKEAQDFARKRMEKGASEEWGDDDIQYQLEQAYLRALRRMRNKVLCNECEEFELGDKVVDKNRTIYGTVKGTNPDIKTAAVLIEESSEGSPPPNAILTIKVKGLEKINEEQ